MAELRDILEKYNIKCTVKQLKQFDVYLTYLLEENSKYNLTAIKEKEDVFYKHFLDSVLPYQTFSENAKVIDIGTGAGFPSIPLAILRTDLQFTLVDSVEKKTKFVKSLSEKLGLNNISVIHARCEDLAKMPEYRGNFDYSIARAVAPLSSLLEYCVPFIKVGGKFIAYKGTNYNQELENSKNAIKLLKVHEVQTLKYDITEIETVRYCIIFDKVAQTDKKYPRNQNKVRLKPLN